MSKLSYILTILFCSVLWILVAGSFAYGLVELTSENMSRIFAGGLVTALMIYNANKLYKVGKLL